MSKNTKSQKYSSIYDEEGQEELDYVEKPNYDSEPEEEEKENYLYCDEEDQDSDYDYGSEYEEFKENELRGLCTLVDSEVRRFSGSFCFDIHHGDQKSPYRFEQPFYSESGAECGPDANIESFTIKEYFPERLLGSQVVRTTIRLGRSYALDRVLAALNSYINVSESVIDSIRCYVIPSLNEVIRPAVVQQIENRQMVIMTLASARRQQIDDILDSNIPSCVGGFFGLLFDLYNDLDS